MLKVTKDGHFYNCKDMGGRYKCGQCHFGVLQGFKAESCRVCDASVYSYKEHLFYLQHVDQLVIVGDNEFYLLKEVCQAFYISEFL